MIPIVPQEPGRRKALALTTAVHVALIGALLYGIHWKSSQPEAVEVELWSSRPAPAVAPPPPAQPKPEPRPEPRPEPKPTPKPEPKPEVKPPPKPDIALKEEKKPPKPEPKKPEPKPEPKKPEVKPEPPKDPFKEMLEREEKQRTAANNQAKLAAAADAEAQSLRAAASKRGMLDYANKIKIKIRNNINITGINIQGNPEASFEVNQLPTGEVLSVKLKKSSGNPALDSAIERAILKSSPLPKPDDLSLFQRTLDIKYKPFEE